MTVAFITEDPTDSHVVGALIERIIGREVTRTHYLAKRGFAAVLRSAAPLAKLAARARAGFIVVMVDCDETQDHFSEPAPHSDCRLCMLQNVLSAAHEVEALSASTSRLVTALTVRTIETWLAVAGGLAVPGSVHRFGSTPPERRRLKEIVYGDSAPTSAAMVSRGVELVQRADLVVMAKTLNSFASFAELFRS